MHLKINDRIKIEMYLRESKTIKEISELIGVSYHTVLREITNRRILKINSKLPNGHISTIEEHICNILKKQPIVCNKCPKFQRNNCTYDYVVYDAIKANESYLEGKKKKSTPKRDKFLKEVEKYIRRGQPLSHIVVNLLRKHGETINRKTLYDWSKLGLIKYDKRKYKKNNNSDEKKSSYQIISRKELLKGKEYNDFLEYVKENPNETITEIDLVEGCKGPNCSGFLLTMIIPSKQFLFAFKIENKQPQSVVNVFDRIEKKIGYKMFRKLFGIILTDQGSEFLKYKEITKSVYSSYSQRCKIFYCEPASPQQKPNIENIHTILRRFIPKGRNINDYEQDDIDFIVSNINSLYKPKYNNKSPIEMFLSLYPSRILKALNIEEIHADEIVINTYNKNNKSST